MQLQSVARALGREVEGDGSVEIEGLAGLEDAGPRELTFVSDAHYARALARSRAGAVFAPPGMEVGRPCIRTPTPYADFGRAVALFFEEPESAPGIHPTAIVADGVELGADVAIGPYAVVGAGCRLGAGTRLHAHVVLYPDVWVGRDGLLHSGVHLRSRVRIGDRAVLHNGVVIGADGFGFATDERGRRVRIPHCCGVELGDDVEVGANTTIDAAHPGHARLGHPAPCTRIQSGVKIDNQCQIGHGCVIGEGSSLCAQVGLAGSTTLGRNVYMAGQSAAKGHVHIGDGALIGGATAVTSNVPAGAQILGVPPGMDRRRWGRVVAVLKRLPELRARIRSLEQRIG